MSKHETFTQCRTLTAWLLSVLLLAGGLVLADAEPAAAAVTACPTAENSDATSAARLTDECVAEALRNVRGYLRETCLTDPRALSKDNPLYGPSECQGSTRVHAEAIAQARYLAQVSAAAVLADGINPNVQWELSYPADTSSTPVKRAGRVDAVHYDRADPAAPIELVEIGQSRYYSEDEKAEEALQYEANLPPGGAGRDVVAAVHGGAYSDRFRIKIRDCDTGDERVVTQYHAHSVSSRGVLMIDDRTTVVDCPDDGEPPLDPVPAYEPEAEDVPEQEPQDPPAPVTVPYGRDDDGNGQDDFWDFAEEQFREIDVPVPEFDEDLVTAGLITIGGLALIGATACVVLNVACLPALTGAFASQSGAASLGAVVAVLGATLFGGALFNLWGDPHLVTLDRFKYDLQTVGEFHLFELPEAGIDVQARFRASGSSVSVLDRIATEVNDHRVEVTASSAVYVDGAQISLPVGGAHYLKEGAFVARSQQGIMLVWPGWLGKPLAVLIRGRDVSVQLPDLSLTGAPRGLLGNADGDPTNDLALRDGTPLPADTDRATLHGRYADSWRVTAEESFFNYGANQSTETFTDRSFPSNIVTIGDFPEAQVAAATQTCIDAGVANGPQFDACLLDILVTGDASFAESAALITDVLVSSESASFSPAGRLDVDFEDAVPPNFVSARYSSDDGTTRLAGPLFDSDGYRFYVRNVGRHDAMRLEADLLAFGPVATDANPQTVGVTVDGQGRGTIHLDGDTPHLSGGLSGTLVETASGTTASGKPFTSFRLGLDLGRPGEALDLQLTPSNFSGVLNTALGVDNIALSLDIPQAQTFATTEPMRVPGPEGSGLSVAEGAGTLESPGAADLYRFTVPDGADAVPRVINTVNCNGTKVTYVLSDMETGTQLGRWANTCGRATTEPLGAGAYQLMVTPNDSASAGDYSFELFALPDPQRFALHLGAVVSADAPLTGAGNLETAASEDHYVFTGGGSLFFDHRACAPGLRWVLRAAGTANQLAAGTCQDRVFTDLADGDYELHFSTTSVSAGSYSFQLFRTPVTPQNFTTTLPLTVADQWPEAGAGNLENFQSVDRYQFSLSVGAPVYVDPIECLADGSLVWSIVDEAGAEEATGGCEDQETATLPAGDHTLVVSSTDQGRGDYYLQAWAVPLPAETFDVALPAEISQDRPGPGAGNIETKASVDIYNFTVDDPDSATYIDEIECSSPGMLRWQLIQEVAGLPVPVADGGCDSSGVRQLAQGEYRLEVSAAGDHRGTYALRIIASEAGSPEILHVPMPTAYYGKAVPIDVSTSCATDQCGAQLHYRETSHSAVSTLGFSAGGWTSVDMNLTGTVPLGQEVVHRWTAAIPGTAVTTTGIDYYVTASDGVDRNEFPTSVATPGGLTQPLGDITEGLLGQPYLHITTVSPPLLTHVPPTIAQADTDLPLELQASCSTGSCVATLHYRTSAGLAPGTTELFGDPGWTTITMNPTATLPLGDIGESLTYRAVIPAENVDTRGLDYYFEVADGHTTSWWPGTMYQGYYAPLDGMRTAYHTVHVLESPHIVHAPVATTPYRSPTAITATSNCPKTRNCTARLYYRTTTVTGDIFEDSVLTEKDYTEAPMTVARVGSLGDNDIISLSGVIPASYADTRGIDYFFRIDDGSTTAWFPGTSHVQGYVNLEGTRVAFQHIRVLEQPHVTPEPVLATEALEDFTITSGMTCATEFCSLTLHWRNDLEPGATQDGWRSVPMQPIGAPTPTPAGAYQRYEYTIPAEEVTTRGIAYYLEVDDGYVREFAPGTSYWGAYLPIDGQPVTIDLNNGNGGVLPIGAFIVRVLERPHPVHVPPLLMPSGQPLPLTATSNCSSPACSATVTWTGQDGVEHTSDMFGERTLDGDTLNPIVPGDLWSFNASLPATATTSQLNYRITVSDGYTSESTIDFIATPSPLPLGLPPLGL